MLDSLEKLVHQISFCVRRNANNARLAAVGPAVRTPALISVAVAASRGHGRSKIIEGEGFRTRQVQGLKLRDTEAAFP